MKILVFLLIGLGCFLAPATAEPVVFQSDAKSLWFFGRFDEDKREGEFLRSIHFDCEGRMIDQLLARTAVSRSQDGALDLTSGIRFGFDPESGELIQMTRFEDLRVSIDSDDFGQMRADENHILRLSDGVAFFRADREQFLEDVYIFVLPDDTEGVFIRARELRIEQVGEIDLLDLTQAAIQAQSRDTFHDYIPPVEFQHMRIKASKLPSVPEERTRRER